MRRKSGPRWKLMMMRMKRMICCVYVISYSSFPHCPFPLAPSRAGCCASAASFYVMIYKWNIKNKTSTIFISIATWWFSLHAGHMHVNDTYKTWNLNQSTWQSIICHFTHKHTPVAFGWAGTGASFLVVATWPWSWPLPLFPLLPGASTTARGAALWSNVTLFLTASRSGGTMTWL